MNLKSRICIIGAGPAGLAMARHLKSRGLPYDQYERHSTVGGIWDIENPGTPMYRSAHFISSRYLGGYYGMPMPEHFPDYPRHTLVLEYLHSFAEAYGLLDAIRFNTGIERVEKRAEGWRVSTATGEVHQYSHVVCTTGHTWVPSWPSYPGNFDGEVMHSVDYRDADLFAGKRVLIVGAGNSACDIACDAAQTADAAFISMRRGYHFIPKHIEGIPTDLYAERSRGWPRALRRAVFERTLKRIHGDLTTYGLQAPDHRLLESHPIINSQLIHYLQHGDISVCRDIERFEGRHVLFKDGRSEAVDLIIHATGFRYDIPYIDPELFDWSGHKPRLSYTVFNSRHDSLFAAGFTEMNAGGFYIFDEMTGLIADALDTQLNHPTAWPKVRRALSRPTDFSGGIRFVQSERHADYIDMESFIRACRRLTRRLNWTPARARLEAIPTASQSRSTPIAQAAE